jgi:hypothetical protein
MRFGSKNRPRKCPNATRTPLVRLASGFSLSLGLEAEVRERTRELTAEIAAREELERQILAVSEREQKRIGLAFAV